MKILEGLMYSESHEWVKFESDGSAVVGVTDFAQHALGGLVFVNLPAVGDSVTASETFADVESVKAASDIYSPVSGKVSEINEALLDSPDKINSTPYEAWFIKVKDITEKRDLMSSDEYKKFCEEEG